jgi:hypothetical protein
MFPITIAPKPNQSLTFPFLGSSYSLFLYPGGTPFESLPPLFATLTVNSTLTLSSARCLHYVPFGPFLFLDTQKPPTDPSYSLLGSRYRLYLLSPSELQIVNTALRPPL